MAKAKGNQDRTEELLEDLLIIELGKQGVPQKDIRQILQVDIHKVNRIARYIKKK